MLGLCRSGPAVVRDRSSWPLMPMGPGMPIVGWQSRVPDRPHRACHGCCARPDLAVAGVCIANSPRGARRWMPLLVSAPIFAAEVLLFPFALAPIQTSAASVVEIALSPVVAEIESHIAQKGRPPLRVKTEPGPVGVLACQTIKYEFPAMPTSSGRTAEWRLRVRCQDWSRRSEYVYPSTGEYVGLPRALLPKSMEHVPARVIPMD